MADYTQLMNLEKKHKGQASPSHSQHGSTEQSTHQPIDKTASQSVSRPTSQSTSQLTSQSTHVSEHKTVERPKSFYITVRLDKRLDEAVRYFQDVHGIKKVDRSILLNAMLDNDTQWTDEALDLLVARIISILTNKLVR